MHVEATGTHILLKEKVAEGARSGDRLSQLLSSLKKSGTNVNLKQRSAGVSGSHGPTTTVSVQASKQFEPHLCAAF